MLDKLKSIFDGKESLTLADFEEATKGMKLVDLEDGEYVGKEKFSKLEKAKAKEIEALTAKLEEAESKKPEPGADDELQRTIKELNEKLESVTKAQSEAAAKATRLEREKVVAASVKNPKLAKLALIEAEALVDEDTDFEAALKQVIEGDPDYTAEQGTTTPSVKVGFGGKAEGTPEANDLIAAIDRGFGEAETSAK